jgi:hypothetical protein
MKFVKKSNSKDMFPVLLVMFGAAIAFFPLMRALWAERAEQVQTLTMRAHVQARSWSCKTDVSEMDETCVAIFLYYGPACDLTHIVKSEESKGSGEGYTCRHSPLVNGQTESFQMNFVVIFSGADGKTYEYRTADYQTYASLREGGHYNLSLNAKGAILALSPIQPSHQ